MNSHGKRTNRGRGLLAVVCIAAVALLASCASSGGVRVKIDFPSDRNKKIEVKVEEKKEAKHEAKAEARAEKKARVKVKADKKKHGPPPYAPAHGYRHRHPDGTELVFDKGLGVYVVVSLSGTYFQDDLYIRADKGRWEVSSSLAGPWRGASSKEVPSKLKSSRGKDHPAKARVSKKK